MAKPGGRLRKLLGPQEEGQRPLERGTLRGGEEISLEVGRGGRSTALGGRALLKVRTNFLGTSKCGLFRRFSSKEKGRARRGPIPRSDKTIGNRAEKSPGKGAMQRRGEKK